MTTNGDWHGLYREGWKGEIVDDAFAHPAKYARGLIRKIYSYAFEQGYLRPGDTVLDPFGGVALGALDAMKHGCNWIGCELEEKFVKLGNENLDRWEVHYRRSFPEWGRAWLVQGDSRQLCRVVEEAGIVVTSPPYAQGCAHTGGKTADTTGQGGKIRFVEYGESPGQLGASTPDTFWSAARTIVDQCYVVLKPGGYAIWVVKRFVRNKEIVDFPGQWESMCQAAGFETTERIRAWLVEEKGTQLDLFGNGHELKTERKSFFRRLYEKKYPENSIDWEDVIEMRKP